MEPVLSITGQDELENVKEEETPNSPRVVSDEVCLDNEEVQDVQAPIHQSEASNDEQSLILSPHHASVSRNGADEDTPVPQFGIVPLPVCEHCDNLERLNALPPRSQRAREHNSVEDTGNQMEEPEIDNALHLVRETLPRIEEPATTGGNEE